MRQPGNCQEAPVKRQSIRVFPAATTGGRSTRMVHQASCVHDPCTKEPVLSGRNLSVFCTAARGREEDGKFRQIQSSHCVPFSRIRVNFERQYAAKSLSPPLCGNNAVFLPYFAVVFGAEARVSVTSSVLFQGRCRKMEQDAWSANRLNYPCIPSFVRQTCRHFPRVQE